MKHKILLCAIIATAALAANDVSAQTAPAHNDSIATSLKLNGLQARRDKLQNEIKAEDAKRNRQMAGVAPETLEEMNDRQDSLCLALRSELVDVTLEIREISPEVASPALLQQFNNLIHKPTPAPGDSIPAAGTTPGKQPAKKAKK